MISAIFATVMASCSPSEVFDSAKAELELFRAEIPEIMQFFDDGTPASREPSVYIEQAEQDMGSKQVLESLTHTDMLITPYHSGRRIIFDRGTPDTKKPLPDEKSLALYKAFDLSSDRAAQSVLSKMRSAGVSADVILGKSPAPEGEVYAVSYAGYSEGGMFYVNPSLPVTLYVSDRKAASSETGRHQNLVYLTFDDGPTEKDTVRILDILDTYGVKAAFFAMGEEIEKYPASAKAVADRGHALGCHSVTHDYDVIYRNTDALVKEVQWWEEIAADAGINLTSKLFRFPGGSVGKYVRGKVDSMKDAVEDLGYMIFDWNVVTNDSLLYMAPGDESTYDYIKENFIETFETCLRENSSKENAPIIILMHETVPETVDLLPWMLEYLIREGFTFGDLATFGESWTFADR